MNIIIDPREQTPFNFEGIETKSATLITGDYSIKGLERFICIERKSKADLLASLSRERERFERELHRMQAYQCRAVIVECEYSEIVNGNYRSKMTSKSAIGSIGAFQQRYQVPFHFVGNHGATYCLSLLNGFYRDLQKLNKIIG